MTLPMYEIANVRNWKYMIFSRKYADKNNNSKSLNLDPIRKLPQSNKIIEPNHEYISKHIDTGIKNI